MHSRGSSLLVQINTCLFCSVIILGGLIFLFSAKAEFSENEKRQLTQFPKANASALLSGDYFRGIDSYVADNFIYRLTITEWASRIRHLHGIQWDEIEYFPKAKSNHPVNGTQITIDQPTSSNTSSATNLVKPSKQSAPTISSNIKEQDDVPYQNIESVIVYKNRALQIFGASPSTALGFTKTINLYREKLDDEVKLYVMAIPIGSDFYLPKKINNNIMKERNLISYLKINLNSEILVVDAYSELEQHTDEYIQFNTDHHWTGLGAYYAYIAFCKTAEIVPLTQDEMTYKYIPNFLGSLYQKTLSTDLKNNPDRVEYWKVPMRTKSQYFKGDYHKGLSTSMYAEEARGIYGYGVFLGGDYPMMRISSEIKNGKRIVVIKDSYGNAFAPYLTSHYEDVFVLDYRYFNGNILSLIKEYDITEILFAHNSYVISSPYTASREKSFLKLTSVNY